MLTMTCVATKEKKNFRIPPGVLAEMTDYIDRLRSQGANPKENEVVSAGLLMFLAASDATKLEWLGRARVHDLEKFRQAMLALEDQERNAAAEVVSRAARADAAVRQGKHRTGGRAG